MNNSLHRLIYTSRNEILGDEPAIQAEVESILAVAREANPELDVTGALMFNTGCFAQVLEGPHDNVQEVFERVQCDMRHSNVVVIDFSPIEARRFDNWSMAYVGDGADKNALFAAIASDSDFDTDKVSGERIYDILQDHLLENEVLARLRKSA